MYFGNKDWAYTLDRIFHSLALLWEVLNINPIYTNQYKSYTQTFQNILQKYRL